MSDETIGEFVEEVQAAYPGTVSRGGMQCQYIGEVQLDTPPDGTFHVPFPDAWTPSGLDEFVADTTHWREP